METEVSRRSFLTGAGAVGLGLAGMAAGGSAAVLGVLGGCSADNASAGTASAEGAGSSSGSNGIGVAGKDVTYGSYLNPQEDFSSATTDYSAIFSPLQIAHVTLKNRLGKSCAGSETQHDDDAYSESTLGYYERFCEGGIGMICVEPSQILSQRMNLPPGVGMLNLTADEGIEAHRVMPEMAHKYDTVVIAQMLDMLMPTGGASTKAVPSKLETVFQEPIMQTTEELQQQQRYFIDAAERYYRAGFDGVELNASCNHYFATYLSRTTNYERTDQYSGESVENRARVLTEIIEGIRERVGKDFIIQVLYSGMEGNLEELGYDELCTSLEEGCEFAKLFEKAGASCLHIRSQFYGHHAAGFIPDIVHYCEHGDTGYGAVADFGKHFGGHIAGQYEGYGALIEVAAKIKAAVNIPVGTVGAMDPRVAPDLCDSAIRDGKIDYMLMNRPLMADGMYANKLKEGRSDEIAPCVRCMTCFVAPFDMGMPLYCRVNPALTRAFSEEMPEGYDPQPASSAKNVMVVGGGPAGMEAARVAAQRGHRVTLYEKSSEMAGLMNLAMRIKGPHERIIDHKNYLVKQLEVQGVSVVTGKEVDAEFVKQEAPDAVVVAVGGRFEELPFSRSDKVLSLGDLYEYGTNEDELPLGDKIVIYGAQVQAGDLAEHVVKQGKTVVMLNPGPDTDLMMGAPTWPRELGKIWLHTKGVRIFNNVTMGGVEDDQVVFDTEFGTTETVTFDTLVDARPLQPRRDLFEALEGAVDEVYAVGDCYAPGTIANATARANLIARQIGNGAASAKQELADNQFSATAAGIGDVTVTITVDDGTISAAEVDTSNETEGIGRSLGEQFAQEILSAGQIDAVSGATLTSTAVQDALAECKTKAGM